jgi:toxin-antitoxin system PIN domain toxin
VRFLVDTNVLLAATVRQLPAHAESREFVEDLLRSDASWCLAWVNVYEFLRVATHPRVFSRPLSWSDATAAISQFLSHPRLELIVETPDHLSALEKTAAEAGSVAGNFVHDCHIAALMREHDVRRIVTFDTHFRRFEHLEVVRPAELSP